MPRLGRTHISNGDFSYCSEGKKLKLISISSFSKEQDGCFHVLFLPTGFEAETILRKFYVLRTSLEVWCKWIVFVPNFPFFFQIPIELHNTILWYLVLH